jgi:hypothetical protein
MSLQYDLLKANKLQTSFINQFKNDLDSLSDAIKSINEQFWKK